MFGLLGILSVLVVVMLCPVFSEEAQADTPVSAGGSSLSVSVSNGAVALEADPNMDDGITLGSVTVSAKTTNSTGYSMRLNAKSSTALKSTDSSNTSSVATLSSSATPANFPANRWGYYFGTSEGTTSTTYKPIYTSTTTVDTTSSSNSTLRSRILTLAAKVDSTLPADTYSTQLVVSVVTNAPADLSSISTMQAMTSTICSNTSTGYEKQLRDTRDSTYYYVGKMKDGHCWMLQNLALDLTTSGLKSTDTNISSNWASSSTYPPQATQQSGVSGSTSPSTIVQSWGYGKWVLATPLLTTSCGNSTSGLSGCTKVGFVNVSSSSFSSGYTATTRSWDGANSNSSTLVAVNCTSWSGSGTSKTCTAGTYDAHYLVGNYYSWNAATAGTGGSITSGQASGSICPKGWELPYIPSSGTLVLVGAQTLGNLLAAYGVESSLTGTVNGTTYNIAGAPLRFVRSGYVNPGTNLTYAGSYGDYWSSTPGSSSTVAYELTFRTSSVNSSATLNRYYGQSVRCVAE